MITKMTGLLVRVLDDEVRLEIGALEYQILVPEAVRRQIQMKVDQQITFYISEYLEGGPNANKFIPRKIGFLHQEELDFFDLFCTVDKIGVKKALKALAQPVRDIANAISREDAKWLTSLPGIGATTAEQIVTSLKRKVTKYSVLSAESGTPGKNTKQGKLVDDIYASLLGLGLSPLEARTRIDSLVSSGEKYDDIEQAIFLIFNRKEKS